MSLSHAMHAQARCRRATQWSKQVCVYDAYHSVHGCSSGCFLPPVSGAPEPPISPSSRLLPSSFDMSCAGRMSGGFTRAATEGCFKCSGLV